MKKWLWAFIIIIAILLMIYTLTYFFILPMAAEASLPYKWKNVVEGLKRNEYEIYLGKAATEGNKDVWVVRNGNYTFSLKIDYNADSIANTVELEYTFSNYLFHKEGNIRNDKEE